MPLSRMVCPACGAELTYDPRLAFRRTGGRPVCPYDGLPYGYLRAGHDRIYFGKWRKIEATPVDVRRAYHQIGRHLSAISQELAGKDLPAARRDLERAGEAFRLCDPREDSRDSLRQMDHALSYAHMAIDGLLHEAGFPPHRPMDFAQWYDAVEVPFQEEW